MSISSAQQQVTPTRLYTFNKFHDGTPKKRGLAIAMFVTASNFQMNSTMTILKPLNNPSLLLPYKQYYIQSLHKERKRIPEQSLGETNPLFQTVINPQPPHST